MEEYLGATLTRRKLLGSIAALPLVIIPTASAAVEPLRLKTTVTFYRHGRFAGIDSTVLSPRRYEWEREEIDIAQDVYALPVRAYAELRKRLRKREQVLSRILERPVVLDVTWVFA